MSRKNKRYRDNIVRMKALDDARIEMVKRREKTAVIHAVSEAYLKLYREVHHENQTRQRRDCADTRP